MNLKLFLLATLLLISIGFSVIPAMAQINLQQPQIGDLVALTQELRSVVWDADNELFQGFTVTRTDQAKSALIKKIDVVITMFEKGNFQSGYKKLDNDLATKLHICGTDRVRALSWLSVDPALSVEVYAFAATCQEIIEDIRLADPRPTP